MEDRERLWTQHTVSLALVLEILLQYCMPGEGGITVIAFSGGGNERNDMVLYEIWKQGEVSTSPAS